MVSDQLQGGKYEILAELGHGTWPVYLAQDTLLGKQVALKVINCSEEDRELFREEARMLDRIQQLNHHAIVRFLGADVQSSSPGNLKILIATEYIEGCDLRQFIRRTGHVPVDLAVQIIVPVLEALSAARNLHIIHRDVKPANILLGNDGRVKLTDFGQAKSVSTHSFAEGRDGTYAYMAPEYFGSEVKTDHRSDLWAVGVTLYEMLTGRRPFEVDYSQKNNPFAYAQLVSTVTPDPLVLDASVIREELQRILDKALAKDPDRRYQSAESMAADLISIARSEPAALSASVRPVTTDATVVEEWDALVQPKAAGFGISRRSSRSAHGFAYEVPALIASGAYAAAETLHRIRHSRTFKRLSNDVHQFAVSMPMLRGLNTRHTTLLLILIAGIAIAAIAAATRVRSMHYSKIENSTVLHAAHTANVNSPVTSDSVLINPSSALKFADEGKRALFSHQNRQAVTQLRWAQQAGDRSADTTLALGAAYVRLRDSANQKHDIESAAANTVAARAEIHLLLDRAHLHPEQPDYRRDAHLLERLVEASSPARHRSRRFAHYFF